MAVERASTDHRRTLTETAVLWLISSPIEVRDQRRQIGAPLDDNGVKIAPHARPRLRVAAHPPPHGPRVDAERIGEVQRLPALAEQRLTGAPDEFFRGQSQLPAVAMVTRQRTGASRG